MNDTAAPDTASADAVADGSRHAQELAARLGQRFAAARRLLQHERPEIREAAMKRWLSEGSGLTLADLTHWTPEQADLELVPFSVGQQRLCVVLRDGSALRHVVLADPFDAGTRMWLESRIRAAGHPPSVWYVAGVNDIAAFYARMEREMANLQGQYRLVEQSYGQDVLNLVLARGYLAKLLENAKAQANMQPKVVESERGVEISKNLANTEIEKSMGEARAARCEVGLHGVDVLLPETIITACATRENTVFCAVSPKAPPPRSPYQWPGSLRGVPRTSAR